jgi:hypothetical protein
VVSGDSDMSGRTYRDLDWILGLVVQINNGRKRDLIAAWLRKETLELVRTRKMVQPRRRHELARSRARRHPCRPLLMVTDTTLELKCFSTNGHGDKNQDYC